MRVEIFTGPRCPHCQQAKALLDNLGVPYADYDISEERHATEYKARLPRLKSIPQIFVDGEHIGGCEDLNLLHGRGELEHLRGSA